MRTGLYFPAQVNIQIAVDGLKIRDEKTGVRIACKMIFQSMDFDVGSY